MAEGFGQYVGTGTVRTKELFQSHPERIIENAVRGMLPKNKLGAELFRNLRVYNGAEHDQQAQQPVQINLNDLK